MSSQALTAILNQMQIWLNETEKEQLHRELLAHFGLIGALNKCQALEKAWKDPYNRREMEAVKKLKNLGLLHACNFTADSALQSKLYKLCEQYAKIKKTPLAFFYR